MTWKVPKFSHSVGCTFNTSQDLWAINLSATTLKLSIPKLSNRCISTAILPEDILPQRDQMSVQHQKEHLRVPEDQIALIQKRKNICLNNLIKTLQHSRKNSPKACSNYRILLQNIIGYYFQVTTVRVFWNLHLLKYTEASFHRVHGHIH